MHTRKQDAVNGPDVVNKPWYELFNQPTAQVYRFTAGVPVYRSGAKTVEQPENVTVSAAKQPGCNRFCLAASDKRTRRWWSDLT